MTLNKAGALVSSLDANYFAISIFSEVMKIFLFKVWYFEREVRLCSIVSTCSGSRVLPSLAVFSLW